MGRLTTHVLDLTAGRPAAGMRIELWRLEDGQFTMAASALTNGDGRLDEPLASGAPFVNGCYELRFFAGDYLRTAEARLSDPPFLDVVPVRFGVSDASAHYHVPLLLSAYGYSTYRGS